MPSKFVVPVDPLEWTGRQWKAVCCHLDVLTLPPESALLVPPLSSTSPGYASKVGALCECFAQTGDDNDTPEIATEVRVLRRLSRALGCSTFTPLEVKLLHLLRKQIILAEALQSQLSMSSHPPTAPTTCSEASVLPTMVDNSTATNSESSELATLRAQMDFLRQIFLKGLSLELPTLTDAPLAICRKETATKCRADDEGQQTRVTAKLHAMLIDDEEGEATLHRTPHAVAKDIEAVTAPQSSLAMMRPSPATARLPSDFTNPFRTSGLLSDIKGASMPTSSLLAEGQNEGLPRPCDACGDTSGDALTSCRQCGAWLHEGCGGVHIEDPLEVCKSCRRELGFESGDSEIDSFSSTDEHVSSDEDSDDTSLSGFLVRSEDEEEYEEDGDVYTQLPLPTSGPDTTQSKTRRSRRSPSTSSSSSAPSVPKRKRGGNEKLRSDKQQPGVKKIIQPAEVSPVTRGKPAPEKAPSQPKEVKKKQSPADNVPRPKRQPAQADEVESDPEDRLLWNRYVKPHNASDLKIQGRKRARE